MSEKKGFAYTPCVTLDFIAREKHVSDTAVESTAKRIGVKVSRTPTGRRLVTPHEADRIAAALPERN